VELSLLYDDEAENGLAKPVVVSRCKVGALKRSNTSNSAERQQGEGWCHAKRLF
jgi:hypothetical protein